jgi:hypothetical protein
MPALNHRRIGLRWSCLLLCLSHAVAADGPWRLNSTLDLPDWADLGVEQRTRYESLGNSFRAGRTGSDQALALRTSLVGQIKTEPVGLLAELMDSRQYLSDSGSAIDTTQVNAVDLLQAHVRWNAGPLFTGGTHRIQIGRETLDLGNRPLVARNAYRNTINAFTGVDWLWTSDGGGSLRSFAFLPVQRLPDDAASLLDNQITADTQSFGQQFYGVYATSPRLTLDARLEAYWLGLFEDTDPTRRHRRLHTVGSRYVIAPKPGHWDFEAEASLQRGTSRANTGLSPDLDHTAWLLQSGGGYTWEARGTPRVGFRIDQASGDRNPGDGENQRFDTLFGARRFEFGPTGIYGAIARANLRSPEVRASVKPAKTLETSLAHRWIWLESPFDAFTAAGVRDASGRSGSYVGQQLEARIRWDVIPGNCRLDTGVTTLFKGSFLEQAPNANANGDTLYAWVEWTFTF